MTASVLSLSSVYRPYTEYRVRLGTAQQQKCSACKVLLQQGAVSSLPFTDLDFAVLGAGHKQL